MHETQDVYRKKVAINGKDEKSGKKSRKKDEDDLCRMLGKKLKMMRCKGEDTTAVEALLEANAKKKSVIQQLVAEVQELKKEKKQVVQMPMEHQVPMGHHGFRSVSEDVEDSSSIDSLGVIQQLEDDCTLAQQQIADLKHALHARPPKPSHISAATQCDLTRTAAYSLTHTTHAYTTDRVRPHRTPVVSQRTPHRTPTSFARRTSSVSHQKKVWTTK
eukprot:TRINITY_DN3494_c0_g2_i1.p1 TRINITY_DN3494_c0_g2~~TRINITY_DN3494_c0_g2_i1.p1  ORF type:complete len:217 (+),score=59.68 TRINITY_DN3494_c0_g2_i1:45-695(+)